MLVDGKRTQLTEDLLKRIFKAVKPGGSFIVKNLESDCIDNIDLLLRTNGFLNPKVHKRENDCSVDIVTRKPTYDIGSSRPLNLSAKAAVWRVEDTIDDDVETIDPDDLLDEEDLKRPDPLSLRGILINGGLSNYF